MEMNTIGIFSKNEQVWVKTEESVEEIYFELGKIENIEANTVSVAMEDEKVHIFSPKDIANKVFKRTGMTDLFVDAYVNYTVSENPEYHIAREDHLIALDSEMWSMLFCDACLSNQGIEDTVEIEGLEYIGSVQQIFGDLDNYKLENVYKLNNKFYVSFDIGNSHCHIALMEENMVKELEEKLKEKSIKV